MQFQKICYSIFLVCISLISFEIFGDYSLDKALPYWSYGPMKITSHKDGVIGLKTFSRVISYQNRLIPIARMTLLDALPYKEKIDETFNFNSFAIRLKHQLPYAEEFSYTIGKNDLKLHWFDRKLLRYINLYIYKKGKVSRYLSVITQKEFYPYIKGEIGSFEKLSSSFSTSLLADQGNQKKMNVIEEASSLSKYSELILNLFVLNAFAQPKSNLLNSAFQGKNILTSGTNRVASNTTSAGGVELPLSTTSTVNVNGGVLVEPDPKLLMEMQKMRQTGDNLNTGLKGASSQFHTTMTTSTKSIKETGQAFDKTMTTSMTSLQNSTEKFNGALTNATGSMDVTMDKAGANIVTASGTMATAVENGSENVAGAMNNLSESLGTAYDPENVAQVAFAGATGAALGTLFVGLVTEGVSLALTGLYNLITQNPEKEKLWENFHKSMKEIDEQNSAISKFEADMRGLIDYSKTLRDKKILDKPLFEIQTELEELKYVSEENIERGKEQFKANRATMCVKCAATERQKLERMQDNLAKINDVIVALKKEDKQQSLNEKLCRRLADLKREVVHLQQSLQNARFQILANENEFAKKLSKEGEEIKDLVTSANKAHREGQEKMIRLVQTYVTTEVDQDRLRACVMAKNQEGFEIYHDLKLFTPQQRFQNVASMQRECLARLKPEIPREELIFENNKEELKFSSIQQKDYVYEFVGFFNQIKEENLCLEKLLLTESLREPEASKKRKEETALYCRFSDRVVELFNGKKAIAMEMKMNKCDQFMNIVDARE